MKKLRNTTPILPMSCWAAEDIPSAKAGTLGFQSLTNSELLSIVIGTGNATENQIDLSRRLLADNNNSLRKISKLSMNDLKAIDGIGQSKAAKILAALELGNRISMERAADHEDLSTAVRVFNYMAPRIGFLDTEEFWALYLNQSFKLIQAKRISIGGITETCVDARIVMREALLCNATILVVCHNHPSGSLRPSKADNQLTESLMECCKVMRIKFNDHIIVIENAYYSYHEQGRI